MTKTRTSHDTGLLAEAAASWFLRCKGYRVVATRMKTPVGEIDLIAKRGKTLVFVEVKTRTHRSGEAEALEAVSTSRIVRAAEHWLARHPHEAEKTCRFDVIFLAPGRWPRHLINAFDAGT